VIDPGRGSFRPVVWRRRTRRHRRNQMIRRSLAIAAVLLTAGVSTLALYYLSPSLFFARHAAAPTFEQAELSRDRLVKLNEILSQTGPSRPVYPYSVVPGGVEDAKELKWVADHDPVVAAHYAGFDYDHARVVRLTLAKTVYVSYRIGNHIYWTRRRVNLHKGEKLITDGRMTARGRCANRVEEAPQVASLPSEPPVMDFDEPMPVFQGTAAQGPPVNFQSALLSRPGTPGLGPAPLSFYNPFSGGVWVPIAPPPLPTNVCGPERKKGTVSSGGGTGKKKTSPCGNGPGTVPEPGTWMMVASGLIGIYGLGRRKLAAV
jgi:PEP-CTERM motif